MRAHACALEGKCGGAHMRTRVSTSERACEDRMCVYVCVCERLQVRAFVGKWARAGGRAYMRARV